jgi:hypothetical protein
MKNRRPWMMATLAFASALIAVPTASAAEPVKTVTAGAGLTGGGSGPAVTLGVAGGGITNAMLANPALTILAGTGLFGGGSVALGGSTTLGIASGGVDTAKLAAGAVTPAKLSANGSSAGEVLTSDGANVSWQSLPSPNAWGLSGNAGTDPSTNYVGTSDNQSLVFRVNGMRALRVEPGKDLNLPASPNLIGGFAGNSVDAYVSGATIGGGGRVALPNTVAYNFSTIAGGVGNTAMGNYASVGGGFRNTTSGVVATVAGGADNTAGGYGATVAGGSNNYASGGATVAGGSNNTASGNSSFAAGLQAKAMHYGTFVWADASYTDFQSTVPNEFSARATGGVRFVSGIDGVGAPTAGVSLAPGSGSWSSLSDRSLKRNFAHVSGSWILERLAGLPISTWGYKAQKPSIRHLGPTAQDFSRAFGLGEDERHIDTIDSEGVSLAGIKALYQLVRTQQRQLRLQQREIRALQRALHTRRD